MRTRHLHTSTPRPAIRLALGLSILLCGLSPLAAQESAPPADTPTPATQGELCPCPPPPPPAPPPPVWTGSLGAGLSTSRGNSENESLSVSFAARRDAGKRHILTLDGLYLRAKSDGTLSVDKAAAGVRNDVRLRDRLTAFGDLRYLRDRFKELDSSLNPTVGLAWAAVQDERLSWSLDAGVGYLEERFRNGNKSSSGTIRFGEFLTWKLSENASVSHLATATVKTDDSDDYLIHAELALATTLTKRSELKIALIDDYRNLPARGGLAKNDLSTIAAVVLKF